MAADGTGSAAIARVLLVDEDLLLLATLSKGIARAGFEMAVAGSANEALETVQRTPPDVALVDVRLPDASGFELARDASFSGVPVVFLSARADEATVEQACSAGALCCLVKPLQPWQIVPTLRLALAAARREAERQREIERLKAAIQSNRTTATAVGIMVERHCISAQRAFELLRARARSERRKLADLAQDLIDMTEGLVQLHCERSPPRRGERAGDVAVQVKKSAGGGLGPAHPAGEGSNPGPAGLPD